MNQIINNIYRQIDVLLKQSDHKINEGHSVESITQFQSSCIDKMILLNEKIDQWEEESGNPYDFDFVDSMMKDVEEMESTIKSAKG